LSDHYRTTHATIPWADIKGMRNFLVHAYHLVSLEIVWDTAVSDVPELVRLLREAESE
jgi:uncharacterized protein with HEPN domain